MASKTVNMQDIATRAGVSKVTVSYALNGSGRVSARMREQIRRIAKEMDYQPQLAAKLLRSSHKGQLGLVVAGATQQFAETGFSGPIFGAFIEACENIGNGYHIEVCSGGTGRSRAFQPPRFATGGLVDGLLIAGKGSPELEQWLTEQSRLPWISLDEPAEHCVIQAMDQGVMRVAQYCHAMGHRRMAYISGPTRYAQHGLGMEGFRKSAQDLALDTHDGCWIVELEIGLDTAAEDYLPWAMEFLSGPVRPTAIHCQDIRFTTALCYAAVKMGLRIPEDLTVTGTGTKGHAEHACPAITTLQPDYVAAVNRAIGMLQQRIRGQKIAETHCWIEPKLVIRHTSGPAPKN